MARTSLNSMVGSKKSGGVKKRSPLQYQMAHYERSSKCFFCPAVGCSNMYSSASALYQHKRAHHPELVNSRSTTRVYDDDDDDGRRFVCPEYDCDKCYSTSQGLYQHKRAKHPWLIAQRERGYTRPNFRRNGVTADEAVESERGQSMLPPPAQS
jgi:hypothetical protein